MNNHKNAEESVMLPRISIIPTDLPFRFKRVQFPVRLCFSITINKSQGQTFNTVGVDLSEDVFTHGQLYVALSRVGNSKNLFVYTADKTVIDNVVYPEALV